MVEDAISFWTEIQRYEDMLAADPKSYCFAPLSQLYRKLRLLDDAISVAQKGCALHPDYPVGFFALGSAHYDKGQSAEARRALERAAVLNPEDMESKKLLGQLYVEAGEIALATRVLGQVLQQNPDDMESAMLLRSVAPAADAVQYEEELLEEADVIEDLTEEVEEEIEEPQAVQVPPLSGAAEIAKAFGELEDFAAPAALAAPVRKAEGLQSFGEPDEFEDTEEPEEFWAMDTPAEPAAPDQLRTAEQTEASPGSGAKPQTISDPLKTATLAELYVSQGFIDKALGIYRDLLLAEPANRTYRSRCAEIEALLDRQQAELQPAAPAPRPEAPAAQEHAPAAPRDAEAELGLWLENIRRRKDGV
jgi:tetratricopeptide (TPR) repeat protein